MAASANLNNSLVEFREDLDGVYYTKSQFDDYYNADADLKWDAASKSRRMGKATTKELGNSANNKSNKHHHMNHNGYTEVGGNPHKPAPRARRSVPLASANGPFEPSRRRV